MKKIVLFVALVCCSLFSYAQFKERLSPKATVSFPAAAEKGDSGGNPYWVAVTEKDSMEIRMMAMVLDGQRFDLSAKTINDNYDDPKFVDAIVKGMLGDRTGVEVLSREKITAGKVKGYDIVINNQAPDEEYPYTSIRSRFFFAGTTIYMLGVYAFDETGSEEIRNKFFNSFTVAP